MGQLCKPIMLGQMTNLDACIASKPAQTRSSGLGSFSKYSQSASCAESQSRSGPGICDSFSARHSLQSNRTCGHTARHTASHTPDRIADALISFHRSGHNRQQRRERSCPVGYAGSTCSRSHQGHHVPSPNYCHQNHHPKHPDHFHSNAQESPAKLVWKLPHCCQKWNWCHWWRWALPASSALGLPVCFQHGLRQALRQSTRIAPCFTVSQYQLSCLSLEPKHSDQCRLECVEDICANSWAKL